MNWKNKLWKYSTAFAVMLVILNPELAEIALFIDAIGLEMFLILMEIQIVAILGALFNTRIKPTIAYVKRTCANQFSRFSWKNVMKESEYLMLAVPSEATLMRTLVLSSATGFLLNAF